MTGGLVKLSDVACRLMITSQLTKFVVNRIALVEGYVQNLTISLLLSKMYASRYSFLTSISGALQLTTFRVIKLIPNFRRVTVPNIQRTENGVSDQTSEQQC